MHTVSFKTNLGDIFEELVNMFLQGSNGVKLILDISTICQSTAMEPRKAYQNIECFERRVEVLQRLRILKNANDEIVTELAKWLFMTPEYQRWNEYRSKIESQETVEECTQ